MKKKSVKKAGKAVKEVSLEDRKEAIFAALACVGVKSFGLVFSFGDGNCHGLSKGLNDVEKVGMMATFLVKVAMK